MTASAPEWVGIIFGCVPAVDDAETRARLLEICAALEQELNLPVTPYRATSPTDLTDAFGKGRVNLAWVSPTLALTKAAFREGVPVASSIRQGAVHYHGILFVRADSPFESLQHLVGTRVAWVDPSSASGYIFPRVELALRGLSVADLFESETFYDSHGAVAQAVLRAEADVGATYAAFEGGDPSGPLVKAGYMEVSKPEDARVLLVTTSIPADLMIASQDLYRRWKTQLSLALTELNSKPNAAEAMRHVLGADGFSACELGAIDELRRQLEESGLTKDDLP